MFHWDVSVVKFEIILRFQNIKNKLKILKKYSLIHSQSKSL